MTPEEALEKLGNTPMQMPLNVWNKVSSVLLEALSATQWQPIETAPVNGEEFWGWGRIVSIEAKPSFHLCRHKNGRLEHKHSHGWFKVSEGAKPTHWMPLPTPPTEGEG